MGKQSKQDVTSVHVPPQDRVEDEANRLKPRQRNVRM